MRLCGQTVPSASSNATQTQSEERSGVTFGDDLQREETLHNKIITLRFKTFKTHLLHKP